MVERKNELEDCASTLLSSIDGIPLPPAIKKSLWKSIDRLITGLVDIPVALFEAKTQKIRSESNALSLITQKASEAASQQFIQDKTLVDRTVNYFGSKLLREQINREQIVQKAINELVSEPPSNDSIEEIDSDWLDMFSKISETKSKEDIQLALAKILVGEIRKPGSFSPRTIQTISMLDQATAKIFQSFCNISLELFVSDGSLSFVIIEPFGSVGENSLEPYGLSYFNITKLQDAGLIQYDINAWRALPLVVWAVPIAIGDKSFSFRIPVEQIRQFEANPSIAPRVKILNFTTVGLELKKALEVSNNPEYYNKLLDWAEKMYNIKVV
jgi:hypothetical protein